MPAPLETKEKIKQLVERFKEHSATYHQNNYNETQVRRDFIDPFFEALGWDIENKKGGDETHREVLLEYKQRDSKGRSRSPDYCFRFGTEKKFFVEAKKPSVDLQKNPEPARQIRKYGWSAKLPISILTDFEEFIVYDTRVKPLEDDTPKTARIDCITYHQYVEKCDYLYDNFSKDGIFKGRFDKYVNEERVKTQTLPVDEDFLKKIEDFREVLAKRIIEKKDLNERDLNYCVQMTIDRIIFLRICEDRGIEPSERLKKISEKENVYKRLLKLFADADDKYNSGLFHFKQEEGREGNADTISPNLIIDDKTIKGIIEQLYFPKSPYEFSQISTEILGSVYERFLGNTITILKSGNRIKVQEKPEVKKAGGVYYTPDYVVRAIVKNTLGKILKDKKIKQVKKLKILDPACGSGSFLIEAYQYLLDWHLDFYLQEKDKYKKYFYQTVYSSEDEAEAQLPASYRLTIEEKKRILLDNIYGLDIDTQAVEVAKLSLLLKCLEGENAETIDQTMKLFRDRALPDLYYNIRCGNALVGPDFYQQEQIEFGFSEEDTYLLNVFNWHDKKLGFGDIVGEKNEDPAAEGFDVIIGNPPYARIQSLTASQQKGVVDYFKQKYLAGKKGNFDIYALFIERCYNFLKKDGVLGFICPHKFFNADFGENLRNYLAENKAISKVVHFGDHLIFKVGTSTCLFFLNKKGQDDFPFTKVDENPKGALEHLIKNETDDLGSFSGSFSDSSNSSSNSPSKSSSKDDEKEFAYETFKVRQPQVGPKWAFVAVEKQVVIDKLCKNPTTLKDVCQKIFQGIATSADPIYVLEVRAEKEKSYLAYSKSLEQEVELEKGIVKPFLMGRDIKKYAPPLAKNIVIFPYLLQEGKGTLMEGDFIEQNYPLAWEYLKQNRKELSGRERGRMKGKNFYAYIYPKSLTDFAKPKIVTPDLCGDTTMALDEQGIFYHTAAAYSFVFNEDCPFEQKAMLGILNSKLLWFFMHCTGTSMVGSSSIRFKTEYLKKFPMPDYSTIKSGDADVLGKLVERMLALKQQEMGKPTSIFSALNRGGVERSPHSSEQIKRQIVGINDQINQLVYKMYGLTPSEIKIVEATPIAWSRE